MKFLISAFYVAIILYVLRGLWWFFVELESFLTEERSRRYAPYTQVLYYKDKRYEFNNVPYDKEWRFVDGQLKLKDRWPSLLFKIFL